MDTIQYIFDALRNKKKDDDVYLCEAFLRVPRKKTEPQYYEMIKSPIDMLKIQQKIKTDVYNELEEFCKDVQLLVDNAKLYYAKVSCLSLLLSMNFFALAWLVYVCSYLSIYFFVFCLFRMT